MDPNWRRGGILVLCVAGGYVLLRTSNRVSAYAEDPPPASTGAPSEGTCHGCHASYDINDPSGCVTIGGLPDSYVPGGDPVPFTVTVAQDGTNRTRSRWGFELTALDANNLFACDRDRCDDTLAPTDHTTKMDAASPDGNLRFYVKQTTLDGVDGTFESDDVVPSATWMLSFRPPDGDIGPITFYVAGNAADGDGTPGGDYIFVNSFTISSPGGNCPARAGSEAGWLGGFWFTPLAGGRHSTWPHGWCSGRSARTRSTYLIAGAALVFDRARSGGVRRRVGPMRQRSPRASQASCAGGRRAGVAAPGQTGQRRSRARRRPRTGRTSTSAATGAFCEPTPPDSPISMVLRFQLL